MSTVALLVPLLASAGFGAVAGTLSHRLPPAQATWLLSVGSVIVALSVGVVLGLVGSVLIGQLPELARLGRWSPTALHDHAMTEPAVGAAAVLALVGALAGFALGAVRHGRAVIAAYRSCRRLPNAGAELAVISDGSSGAMALPGRPGRIVVARSLLSQLSARERRVVIAHERAHLEGGHHWHRAAVRLAAATNPMLRPVRAAIAYATERWADEAAAAATGDRRQVAHTLARVSLLDPVGAEPGAARFADGSVACRAAALLEPAPAPQRLLAALVVLGLGLSAVAALILGQLTENVFDVAVHIYRAGAG